MNDSYDMVPFRGKCAICGQDFDGQKMELLGVSLTPKVCNPCSERLDASERARSEAARRAAHQRNIEARDEAWERLCPKEFRLTSEREGCTDLIRLEREQPGLAQVLKWDGPRGLIIRGPSGKCKTRAMWRLVRRLFLNGKRVNVMTSGQFDRQCRDAGGNFTMSSWFGRLAELDVLVMDDLGKAAWSPATEATWFDLVDERTREGRPIIITTNDTGSTLAQRMTPERAEMMVRRLRDFCETIVFK